MMSKKKGKSVNVSAFSFKEAEVLCDCNRGGFSSIKSNQCNYTNISARGLGQDKRMKHRISQVNWINDSEEEVMEKNHNVIL